LRAHGSRAVRAALVAGGVVALALVGFAPGAGAGAQAGSAPLTVVKTVSGVVPAGTTFTATVQCDGDMIFTGDGSTDVATVTFDASGQPTSADTITFDDAGSCTVTETATGGAASTTYACEGSAPVDDTEQQGELSAQKELPDAVCETSGPGPITVNVFAEGQEALVTIHNTFPTPDPGPGPQAAPQVVAQPAFTG
jgi:hypothetical protein